MTFQKAAAVAAAMFLAVSLAKTALADLVTGTFTGVIFDSYAETDEFGAGLGFGIVDGQTVTGVFSYQLTQVPANQCTGQGCYYDLGGINWLKSEVIINGVTLSIDPTSQRYQWIDNWKLSGDVPDYFRVYED